VAFMAQSIKNTVQSATNARNATYLINI